MCAGEAIKRRSSLYSNSLFDPTAFVRCKILSEFCAKRGSGKKYKVFPVSEKVPSEVEGRVKNRGFLSAQNKNRPSRAFFVLCAGEDSNLHALRRYHLKVVRLPISPPAQYFALVAFPPATTSR